MPSRLGFWRSRICLVPSARRRLGENAADVRPVADAFGKEQDRQPCPPDMPPGEFAVGVPKRASIGFLPLGDAVDHQRENPTSVAQAPGEAGSIDATGHQELTNLLKEELRVRGLL